MASKVDICNLALSKIGAQTISDIGAANKNSQLCSQFLDPTIDEVLRLHPWNCATARATLAAASDPPAYGFDYQYPLPVSPYCLRVLSVNESPNTIYKVEGRFLLTNESYVNLLYIKRIVDPSEFDSLMISLIATRLAFRLALPITQSPPVEDRMNRNFELDLREARYIDAQEGSPDQVDTSTWVNARLS